MVQVKSHWKCLMVNFNLAWMAQLPTWIKRIKKKKKWKLLCKKSGNFITIFRSLQLAKSEYWDNKTNIFTKEASKSFQQHFSFFFFLGTKSCFLGRLHTNNCFVSAIIYAKIQNIIELGSIMYVKEKMAR